MSTRGLFGFRKDDIDKAVYNHFDSYPEGLGKDFLTFIRVNGMEKLTAYFDKIELIDSHKKPTEEQIAHCKENGWCDTSVSERNETDWYCLLRRLQSLDDWQKAIDKDITVYVDNYIDFIKDSLFCEYAYILNFDTGMLEFWVGFQKLPQVGNRYGVMPDENDGYCPCRLIMEIPMTDDINITDIIEKMCKKTNTF